MHSGVVFLLRCFSSWPAVIPKGSDVELQFSVRGAIVGLVVLLCLIVCMRSWTGTVPRRLIPVVPSHIWMFDILFVVARFMLVLNI